MAVILRRASLKRQNFSKEFKQEAVRLLEKREKDASQLARELGIRRNQLYKWQKEIESHGDGAFPGKGCRPIKQDETASLKARIKRLEQENEILKKAAVYFAKEIG
jgi:transposase